MLEHTKFLIEVDQRIRRDPRQHQQAGEKPESVASTIISRKPNCAVWGAVWPKVRANWLSTVGLLLFSGCLIALELIDGISECLRPILDLYDLDLGMIEITTRSQVVMLIVFPMGFALSLGDVAANVILNARMPLEMQGRVFVLQMVLAGLASILPLLGRSALSEIVDVRALLGLLPLLLLFAWSWSHWVRPDHWPWLRDALPTRRTA